MRIWVGQDIHGSLSEVSAAGLATHVRSSNLRFAQKVVVVYMFKGSSLLLCPEGKGR